MGGTPLSWMPPTRSITISVRSGETTDPKNDPQQRKHNKYLKNKIQNHPPPLHTKAKILIQPVWGGGSWGEILGHEKEKECSRAKFKYLRTKFKIPPAYKSQNSNPTSGGEAGGRFWVMRKRRTAGVEQLQFTEKIITIWIYFFGSLLVLKTGTPPPVPSQPSTS